MPALAALAAALGIDADGLHWLAIVVTRDDRGEERVEIEAQRHVRIEPPDGAVTTILGALRRYDVTLTPRPDAFTPTERAKQQAEGGH